MPKLYEVGCGGDMKMIIKLQTYVYYSDWTEMKTVEIETEEYNHFHLVNRGGWYLICNKYDKDNERWDETEYRLGPVSKALEFFRNVPSKVTSITSPNIKNGVRSFVEGYVRYTRKFMNDVAEAI